MRRPQDTKSQHIDQQRAGRVELDPDVPNESGSEVKFIGGHVVSVADSSGSGTGRFKSRVSIVA